MSVKTRGLYKRQWVPQIMWAHWVENIDLPVFPYFPLLTWETKPFIRHKTQIPLLLAQLLALLCVQNACIQASIDRAVSTAFETIYTWFLFTQTAYLLWQNVLKTVLWPPWWPSKAETQLAVATFVWLVEPLLKLTWLWIAGVSSSFTVRFETNWPHLSPFFFCSLSQGGEKSYWRLWDSRHKCVYI